MSLIARQALMNHHQVGMNHHLLQLTQWHYIVLSGLPIDWNWEYRFAINCNCNSENAINYNCTSENANNFPGLLQILKLIVIAVNMLAPLYMMQQLKLLYTRKSQFIMKYISRYFWKRKKCLLLYSIHWWCPKYQKKLDSLSITQ